MIMDEIVAMKKEYKNEISKMQNMKQPIILFGCGNTALFNAEYFEKLGIKAEAFCDNSLSKQGKKIAGLDVLSFAQVREKYPNAYYYITTQLYYTIIRNQLLENGIVEESISQYDIIFQFQWEEQCIDYYDEHKEKIEQLYAELQDDKSRKVLRNRLMFLQTRKREYATEIRDDIQYFDQKIIPFSRIGCFVDVGMYTGDTILQFQQLTDNKKPKIYGFEPDEHIYRTAENNLKDFDNVITVRSATSDYDGTARVENTLGVMQTIEKKVYDISNNDEEEPIFNVCTIDSYFSSKEEPIDMIKMDIEGAELETLRGAEKTLKKNKPLLAICVYHKMEDIFAIPEYLKSIGLDYKIYLRHYSDNQTETVCYLVP